MKSLLLVVALVLVALPVRADEVAPALETGDLHGRAQVELARIFAALSAADRTRLAGTYVAFDPTAADAIAQVACDDDGDPVILVSDAMLTLAVYVARADEAQIDAYAAFLGRTRPGRRLLPPAPGFFAGKAGDVLSDVIAFVVARELAHLRAGDRVCPSPTATKEIGDDVWSSREQRAAAASALATYGATDPARAVERDEEATTRVLDSGRSEKGALAMLRLFERLEGGRFVTSYGWMHPDSGTRAATVRRVAEARRQRTR